jgi:ParB-like chromosome segregation protein Spo0J
VGPLAIETVPLSSVSEDPRNARLHDEANLRAIESSLAKFGQVEPLVVQASSRRVIGGNGRREAMRRLGWSECQVVVVDLPDDEAEALSVALNRTGELASWNGPLLLESLERFKSQGTLEALGFSQADLEALARKHQAPPYFKPVGEPEAQFQCPSCGYGWRGNPRPDGPDVAPPPDRH